MWRQMVLGQLYVLQYLVSAQDFTGGQKTIFYWILFKSCNEHRGNVESYSSHTNVTHMPMLMFQFMQRVVGIEDRKMVLPTICISYNRAETVFIYIISMDLTSYEFLIQDSNTNKNSFVVHIMFSIIYLIYVTTLRP